MAIDSPKNDFAEKHRWLTYADEPDTVYDGSKIMDGSVTTEKLADYAVTTDKIDDESITLSKLDADVLNLVEDNVKAFDTVADMQAATLTAGDICHTNGFHSAGDGGAAFYKIAASGTANGMDVLACGDVFAVLENTGAYIQPKQLGAYGNGSTDDYSVLQYALDLANSNGGTVYLPIGEYVVSKCLVVGSNTTLIGDGKETLIRCTQETNVLGEAVAVCGSNVLIENLAITYANPNRNFSSTSANMGALGVGAYTYQSAKLCAGGSDASVLVDADQSGITIRDFYCDATYGLQTETGATRTGVLSNITYDNIICPNGVVSIQGNRDNSIIGANISNVICSYFRNGSGYDLNAININNVKCNMLRGTNRNGVYSNIIVDYTDTCAAKAWVTAGTVTHTMIVFLQESTVSNMVINANGADMTGLTTYGYVGTSERKSIMSNITVMGVNSTTKRAVDVVGTDDYHRNIYVGCNFKDNNGIGDRYSGVFIGCALGNVDSTWSHIYADNYTRPISPTLATGFTNSTSHDKIADKSSYAYDRVTINGTISTTSSAYLTNTETLLFTVADRYKPKQEQFMHATVFTLADTTKTLISPAVIRVATDGGVYLTRIVKFASNTYTAIAFDNAQYVVGSLAN